MKSENSSTPFPHLSALTFGEKLLEVPTYYLAIFFPENCTQMKQIGQKGARIPGAPLVCVNDKKTSQDSSYQCVDHVIHE